MKIAIFMPFAIFNGIGNGKHSYINKQASYTIRTYKHAIDTYYSLILMYNSDDFENVPPS